MVNASSVRTQPVRRHRIVQHTHRMSTHQLEFLGYMRLLRAQALIAVLALSGALASDASAQRSDPVALSLRDVFDSIRTGHPLVRVADARVRAARGVRSTLRSFANPVLTYQVENTPFPGGNPIVGMDREAMTMAMVPLEPIFQRGPRVRRGDAEVRAAEAEASVTRQHLALDAAHAFYRVAVAEVGVTTARELSAWLDTVVAYNRARVIEGVTAEADLIRTGLERDRAVADVAMQEAELARARAELSAFIGDVTMPPSPFTVIAAQVPLTPPLHNTRAMDGVAVVIRDPVSPDIALPRVERAEVLAARERLTAATAGVSIEQRMFIRELGAVIGTKRTMGMTSMIAGVSLPIPLFNANRGEIARAAAERDIAAYELANQLRSTRADIAGAEEATRLLTAQMALLARRGAASFLGRAEEARRIALGAYREGAAPLLQVLDAARAWGDARTTYYRTLYAQHESVLALFAARGIDLLDVRIAIVEPTPSPR
jgi:cobalt-zinc-cadmium efflux system outer membrane protein